MRIAFLVTSYPALSATFIQNQITGLIERGHAVDIIADRPGDNDRVHPDVERHRLLDRTTAPSMPAGAIPRLFGAIVPASRVLFRSPRRLARSLSVGRYGVQAKNLNLLYAADALHAPRTYDVIHAHFGPNGVRGIFLRDVGLLRGPLITTFHGYDVTRTLRSEAQRGYRTLFDHCELLLPISEHWKSRLIDAGAPADRIAVHHMGIDCDSFVFRERTRNAGEPTSFLSIARLVEKKGIADAIRAVARIEAPLRYRIAGDGPLREQLDALIDSLGVRDRVDILGWQSHDRIRTLLDEAHVLLAPSVTASDGDMEGIPVVLMEAMAMGLPVLTTHHSGIPELVDDGVNGVLVPEHDVDGLSRAMMVLIDDPTVWSRMGHAGRTTVERDFNIATLNDALVRTYADLRASSG